MPKVKVYNQEGKENGSLELNDAIFGVTPKLSVVHQVYHAILANARQPWADTKDRGEVRGGGIKPWKQRGTGRARHGSIRSPLWVGGGVTFGPLTVRTYKQKINKKMNALAVKMCLSDKVADEKIIIVDELTFDGKVKPVSALRNKLPGAGKTTVLLANEVDEKLNLSTRNIKNLDMQQVKDVNVVDLLNHQYVIITKKGIDILEKRLAK